MLESYVTPLITSYLSKYIKNIRPSDLQLSFWGGDVVLRNLELRPDTIEESLKGLVPFKLKSGCVKSLTIHIPWTAIGSEAITLSLDNVECSVKLRNLRTSSETASSKQATSTKTTPITTSDDQSQQAPGYVQGLMNRIVNNIVITVQNLIVSVIEEESDLLMSFTVKSLKWCAANDKWVPEYVHTDSFQGSYSLCKMCSVSGMTVCLDQIENAGHVEMYEEPFVPRCSIECHWMSQYEAGILVENKVDLLINDLVFSVTEVQFSLFLHLLDWLVAIYYSYKKIKGRDDLEQEGDSDSQVLENNTKMKMSKDPEGTHEAIATPSPPLSPVSVSGSSTDEQGWGSWLYSFVDDGSESTNTVKPVKQVSSPILSLNLIAKHITVDLKITQKKRDPVFFTCITKVPTQVIKINFLGCLAHVSRVPLTTLLGVSVGIMSVNAWIGGLCPCRRTKKKANNNGRGCFEDTQVHVYSLGSFGVDCDTSQIVQNTFFQPQDNDHGPATLTPKDWLQQKDHYKAVWFSYEYYDKGVDRQESCDEVVVIGEQSLIMSPDVIHCVWFFIEHFLTSLEAIPMASKDMVVIGDPLSQTNLQVLSDHVTVLFTANHHISRHSMTRESGVTKTPPVLDSVVLSYEGLKININMPMYSGNDTATIHQEFYLNVECCQLRIFSHHWPVADLSTRTNTSLSGLTNTNTGLSVPNLALKFRKTAKGNDDSNESHCRFQTTRCVLALDCNELFAYSKIYSSWTGNDSTPPLSTIVDSLASKQSQVLSLQLFDCYCELDCLPIETRYTISLQDIRVSFTVCDTVLPVVYCLMNTSQLVQHDNVLKLEDLNGLREDQIAVQIHVIQRKPKAPGSLSVQLKASGILIVLESQLLSFVNTILNNLVTPLLNENSTVITPQQEVIFSPGDRPDPEGLSSADLYGSPGVPTALDLPSSSFVAGGKDKEEDTATTALEGGLLSVLNEIHLSIKTDHVIIVSIVSSSDYSSQLHVPQSPFHIIKTVLNTADAVFLVLPAFNVHTTDSHIYPSFATKIPGASSWQASLTDGALYVIQNGGIPSYVIHPFSLEVSVAPVQSSVLMGGVSGYGVHLDSNLFHFSFSRNKVLLSKQALLSVIHSLSPLFNSKDAPDLVVPKTPLDAFNKHPASVISSPRHSQISHSIYHPFPASDSSFSIISSSGSQPSLWLQCTLTKLVVDLSAEDESDTKTKKNDSEKKKEFVYESEDISFSLDKQEKRSSCQLKVCTLEGYQKEWPNLTKDNKNWLFEKIFSSRSTILNEKVLQKIEVINDRMGSSRSPVLDKPPMSHRNFIVLDIKSHSEVHKSLELSLNVQMFEGVVCVPLTKAVLDILKVILEQTGNQHKSDGATNNWPTFEVNLESFRVLFPCLSASSGLLADIGGVVVKSDLSYPIGRMEVNTAAFRKLNIFVSEKRIPPLPGYEVQLFTLQLLGLNIDNNSSVSAYSVLVTNDIQVQHSPALQWPVTASSNREKVYATGNSVEICFKSDVEVFLGLSQVACVAKLARDFSSVLSLSYPSNQVIVSQEQFSSNSVSLDTTTPYHLLLTTKNLQISYLQGSALLAIQLTLCDLVVMVTKLSSLLSLKLSIFSFDSVYYNQNAIDSYSQLLTTTSVSECDTLNCLSVNIEQNNESCVSKIKLDRSINLIVSPELLTLVHTIGTDLLLIVTPFMISSQLSPYTPSHLTPSQSSTPLTEIDDSPSNKHKTLTKLKLNFRTKQLTLQLMGIHYSHTNNSCVDCLVISCNEVTVFIPADAAESTPSDDDDNDDGVYSLITQEDISLTANIHCIGIHVKCLSHVISCTEHMASLVLLPTNFMCNITHYFDTELNIKCAHTVLSLLADPNHVSGGLATIELFQSVLLSYIVPLENVTKLFNNQNNGNNGLGVEEESFHHDDLRQGGMTFNTDDIHWRVFPKPGEVRFFEGDTRHLPHMIWQFKEPRCVTEVSILPVPLDSHVGYPRDFNIYCEFAYFDEIDKLLIPVGCLHLSETSTATLEHINMDSSISSVENKNIEDVHARIWCITIIGLERSDEGPEDGTDIHISEMSTGSVLSPLALAGCTTIVSVIRYHCLPSVSVGIHLQHTVVSLLNQPKLCTRAKHYDDYEVQDDLSWHQLCLIEVGFENLIVKWTMKRNRQQIANVDGTISMSVQDLRNLTLREIIHPTRITTNLILKQATESVALDITMEPCLIRVSPTLIHTITMATNILSQYCHQSPITDTDKLADDFTQLPVFAAHIICNNTTTCFSIGQESTIEWLSLPRRSCIGYHWSTHRCEQQRLRLGLMDKEDCQWSWSSSFSLDQGGIQEITVNDQVLVYIEVIKQNGIRTQIVISGLWTIVSHLPHPLFVCPVLKESQTATVLEIVETGKEVSFIVDKSLQHGGTLRVATVDTSQTRSNNNWFDVSVKKQSCPIPIKISADMYFWCNILQQTNKIVFEPLFKVINNHPQNLVVHFKPNNVTAAPDALCSSYSISGRGNQTDLCSLFHNTWYLVTISDASLGGVVSSPFPLSTCIINQIPATDGIECSDSWPYNECTKHRSISNDQSKSTSMKTLFLPITTNGDSIPVHVQLHRDITSNTVIITLSPDVLIVNETGLKLQIITLSKGVIVMDNNERNVTALVSRNEEVQIKMNGSIPLLGSSSLIIVPAEEIKDKKKKIKKIKFQDNQAVGELIVEISLHRDIAVATLKPSHIIINKTPHQLFVLPYMESSLSQSSSPFNTSNHLVSLNCSESKPIPNWIIKDGTQSERLVHLLKVTVQPINESAWSIPLLLNFVRHSFSLPVIDNNSTPPTSINCLVTTHELDKVTYVVINTDPSPRLTINNLCPHILEIKEANTHWIHSHSQTVRPHSQVAYEPPTLAMQYPLIKEWADHSESNVQQSMSFKHLSNVDVQIGYQYNHDGGILWSNPFKICNTNGVVVPHLNYTVDVSLSKTSRTTVMSIIPLVGDEKEQHSTATPKLSSVTADSTPLDDIKMFSMEILLRQLIIILDIENPTVIQPALIISSDHTLINIRSTSRLKKVGIVMDTIQIDNCIPSSLYPVVICPRVVHDPPASLLRPNYIDPFIKVSVDVAGTATYETILTNVDISIQPTTIQLDDVLILRLLEALISFTPPLLSLQSVSHCTTSLMPTEIIAEAERDIFPLSIQQLQISPLEIYLTAHMSQIISLSCDDSALRFSRVLLTDAYTNMSDLSQSITLYYINGLIMQLGSVIGSLDLIGSPSLLVHRLQTGLYNFIYLPYEGITRGPGFFVLGVGQGVSSLLSNVSVGVLRAVTNFSTSIANNMERLSLDPTHSSYQLALRQSRSSETTGLGSSIFSGISSFGMSLMSAVAGVVDQPMQMIHQSQSEDVAGYTQGLLAGMGKGLLGLVTKPVGGAFQFVSQTGQGLLRTSGLARTPSIKNSDLHGCCQPLLRKDLQASFDKYMRLLQLQQDKEGESEPTATHIIFYDKGTIQCLPSGSVYSCRVLLCNNKVHVFDTERDAILCCFNISQYQCQNKPDNPTLQDSSHIMNTTHKTQCNTLERSTMKQQSTNYATTDDVQLSNSSCSSAKLGGKTVIMIRDDNQNNKELEMNISSYSRTVERYLDFTTVNRDVCESALEHNDQNLLSEQYTLTFFNSSGKLFQSLFNHRKNIINCIP